MHAIAKDPIDFIRDFRPYRFQQNTGTDASTRQIARTLTINFYVAGEPLTLNTPLVVVQADDRCALPALADWLERRTDLFTIFPYADVTKYESATGDNVIISLTLDNGNVNFEWMTDVLRRLVSHVSTTVNNLKNNDTKLLISAKEKMARMEMQFGKQQVGGVYNGANRGGSGNFGHNTLGNPGNSDGTFGSDFF